MKLLKSVKAFTLIELLIVIAIIGILAVAFLPTLLNAPAKGRDTSRIADLQKIQKVLINGNLQFGKYPISTGNVMDGLPTGFGPPYPDWGLAFKAAFGGKLPVDPTTGNIAYKYYKGPIAEIGNFAYGLRAKMETAKAGNAVCQSSTDATPGAPKPGPTFDLSVKPTLDSESCYVILGQ